MTYSKENELLIDNFNYELPDERIAKFPVPQRDKSKLLYYKNGDIRQDKFVNISSYLPENALLVYNNTSVIQARLVFRKDTGARIEVFCLEPTKPADYAQSLGATAECTWKCMVGNLKKWKEGVLTKEVMIGEKSCIFKAEFLDSEGNMHSIHFSWDNADIHFADILEKAGELPIPPYLNRKTEESDIENYQTVYSKIKGSVAAPTAGLHFTPAVFESLKLKNIETEELTLHVGAGTFQPVKTASVQDHTMHTEVIEVHKSTIEHILAKLGNIIAVGTTSVRTLESLYYIGCMTSPLTPPQSRGVLFHVSQWQPYVQQENISVEKSLQNILDYLSVNNLSTLHAETQIMIKPGYTFRIVDGIITNFHQPKSTLLLLVSAFVDGNWKNIYEYAMGNDFRFLSYGDSSLLLR